MKDKTARVLLGKYLTSKVTSSPKPKEQQKRKSSSPVNELDAHNSFAREEVPSYAKPLRTKVKPLETPSFKKPSL